MWQPASLWRLGGLALLCWPWIALGQTPADIYTCIDAQGRRLTSDRPIPACIDREQRVLGSTGVLRRVLPPSLSPEERARLDAQRRLDAQQRERQAEEQRRERVLLMRFPTRAVHERERSEALAQIDAEMAVLQRQAQALAHQRQEIDTELEFYRGDLNLAPPWLRRKYDSHAQQVQLQQRFLQEQRQERQRVQERFDEELTQLSGLWVVGADTPR